MYNILLVFLKVVPAALEVAMEEDVAFRQGLPLDYLTYMGVQNSDMVENLFSFPVSQTLDLLHTN